MVSANSRIFKDSLFFILDDNGLEAEFKSTSTAQRCFHLILILQKRCLMIIFDENEQESTALFGDVPLFEGELNTSCNGLCGQRENLIGGVKAPTSSIDGSSSIALGLVRRGRRLYYLKYKPPR